MARSLTRLRGIQQQQGQREQAADAAVFNRMERPRGTGGMAPGTEADISLRAMSRKKLQPIEQLKFTEGRQKIADRMARDAFNRRMAEESLGMQKEQQVWERGMEERRLTGQETAARHGREKEYATHRRTGRELDARLAERRRVLDEKVAAHKAGAPLRRMKTIAEHKQAEDIAMGRTPTPAGRRTAGARTAGTRAPSTRAATGKPTPLPKETADAMAQTVGQMGYNIGSMYQPGTTDLGPQGLAFKGHLELLNQDPANKGVPQEALAEEAALMSGFPMVDPKRQQLEQEMEQLKQANLQESGGKTWETRYLTWDSAPFKKNYNRIMALQSELEKMPAADPKASMKRLQQLRTARQQVRGALAGKRQAAQTAEQQAQQQAQAQSKAQYERIAAQYPERPTQPAKKRPQRTLAARRPVANRSGQPVRPLPEGARPLSMEEAAAYAGPGRVKYAGRQAYELPATGAAAPGAPGAPEMQPTPAGPPQAELAAAQARIPEIDAQIAEEQRWTPEGAPNERLQQLQAEKARLQGVLESGAPAAYEQMMEEVDAPEVAAGEGAAAGAVTGQTTMAPRTALAGTVTGMEMGAAEERDLTPQPDLEARARRGDLAAKRDAAAQKKMGISRADERKMQREIEKRLVAKDGEEQGIKNAKKMMAKYRAANPQTKKKMLAEFQAEGKKAKPKTRQEGDDTTPAIEPATLMKELATADPTKRAALHAELMQGVGNKTITQKNILEYIPEKILAQVVPSERPAAEAGFQQLAMARGQTKAELRKQLPDTGFARLNQMFDLGLTAGQLDNKSVIQNNLMAKKGWSRKQADEYIRKYQKYADLDINDILRTIKAGSAAGESYVAPTKIVGRKRR